MYHSIYHLNCASMIFYEVLLKVANGGGEGN